MRKIKKQLLEQEYLDDMTRDMIKNNMKGMIDDLSNKHLSKDDREVLRQSINKKIDMIAEAEDDNDKYWFEQGKDYGEIKGLYMALGAYCTGLVVGKLIKTFIFKK